jgi:CRP-like cAMP-binding protein
VREPRESREQAVGLVRLLLCSFASMYAQLGLDGIGTARDAVDALASPSRSDLVRLRPGDVLFESGVQSNGLYALLISGTLVAHAVDGPAEPVIIDAHKSQTVIGEISFISGSAHTRALEAGSSCEVLFIPTVLAWSLIERFPTRMKRLIFASFLPRAKSMFLLSRLIEPDDSAAEIAPASATQSGSRYGSPYSSAEHSPETQRRSRTPVRAPSAIDQRAQWRERATPDRRTALCTRGPLQV